MLARGVLARLTADVPTTCTHDLARAAHVVHRRLLTRNGLFATSAAARSRAYKAALLQYRRSYVTAATTPTPKVKKAVKEAVAKKATPKTKPAAKKKAAPKRKAVPKKKKAAKPKPKPKPKPKRVKKVLTEEQTAKLKIKELKQRALSPPTSTSPLSAWQAFSAEVLREGAASPAALQDAGARFRKLTPAEKEHYNHLANERTNAKRAEYRAWIESYTPDQIRDANNARNQLKRKLNNPTASRRYAKLVDDRLLKHPMTAFLRFLTERRKSGDLRGIDMTKTTVLIGNEWKALSASEKQKYIDEYNAECVQYRKEYEKVYGNDSSATKS